MPDATQAPEAERGLLGALLIEPDLISRVRDLLRQEDFYGQAEGHVFTALLALVDRSEAIDLVLLSEELRKANRLEAVGGLAYLTSLASGVATAVHAGRYALMIRDAALRRRQRRLLSESHQAYAEGRDEDAAAAIEAARDVAAQISREHSLLPSRIDVLSAIAETPPDVPFLLPGLAPSTVGIVAGMGAVGKSALLLSVAVSVCAGVPLAGGAWQPPKSPGRVVYLAGEDSELILKRRLHALGEHLTKDPEGGRLLGDLSVRLDLRSLVGRVPTLVDEHGQRTALWHQVKDAARDARLLILDPLSRFHALDENDNRLMTLLVQHLEAIAADTGAAILIAHHTSKAAVVSGTAGEQQAARGASALVDGARWVANLWRLPAKEAEKLGWDERTRRRHAILTVPKVNYADPPADALLVFKEGGILAYEGPWNPPQKEQKAPKTGRGRFSDRDEAEERWEPVPKGAA